MQHTWLRRVLPLLVLGVAGLIAYGMVASRPALPQRESQVIAPQVDVMLVEPGAIIVNVFSRGTVRARHDIELVSEVSGRVVDVAPEFVQGGVVRADDMLLQIDPIDYEVALSVAKADLASAELSLAEVQVVVARAAIEEAEARVRAASDRVRQAAADLANTRIAAPFDAIIDSKRADLGQYVQSGSALMRLMSTGTVEIRLPILAADVPFVRYGQAADGSWPQATLIARFGDLEQSWQARLVRLEQRVDEQTRVYYLVAEVDAPYDLSRHAAPLTVGQFVEAVIANVSVADAVSVPHSALYEGDSVYLVEDGKLIKRQVEVLRRDGGSVIIGAGLEAGEQLVLSRLDLMVPGMPVTASQT